MTMLDLEAARLVSGRATPQSPPARSRVADEAGATPPDAGRSPTAPHDGARIYAQLAAVNKDLWLVLSMLIIAGVANHLLVAQKIVFGFYTLPTILAAYYRGRRHATLTAAASALLVGLLTHLNPALWTDRQVSGLLNSQMLDILAWGSMLMIMAYAMGTLYERQVARSRELQQTYQGLLLILRQFISNDKYTENHSYRVSVYAVTIGHQLGLNAERLDLVRAAGLLHDLGKLETSRQVLHKAAKLTTSEMQEVRAHAQRGAQMLEPVAASMGRILPIILAHHDHFDGSGYRPTASEDIPLEARIIAVADVYDALTSDRPYRRALTPGDARDTILAGSGKEFDPQVVQAFQRAFERGLLEVPEIYV